MGEVGYEHSIFTVAQLYQLCSVCGMLEDGGSNRADHNGWVVTDGAKGCIHPPAESKARSGAEICEENHMLDAATTECSQALNPDSESDHERFGSIHALQSVAMLEIRQLFTSWFQLSMRK